MAVDIKKLIAAINPDVFCSDERDDRGKKISDKVKDIVKKEGYLKGAETAELREPNYVDIIDLQFKEGAFKLNGLKYPIEQHSLVYDASSQTLEEVYFWILDFVNDVYGSADKLVDNFIASPGSGHFAEFQARQTRMQEEGMKIFGTIGTVLRSIMNIIYDLKEFKLRLAHYEDLNSGDENARGAAKLSLKQIWLDSVDIKRGNSAIKAMAQQFDYVTLIDGFMAAESLEKLKEMDLNDRVRRILEQRVAEFDKWVKESERELKKRFEIEKTYLKSQVNSIRMYSRWVKPYLKASRQLEQNAEESADIVNVFNTVVFELVLLAKGRYNMEKDVAEGELPKAFKNYKMRECTPVTLIEFRFRSIPERVHQQGGYGYRGRVDVMFTSFALNDDELKVLKESIDEDDFGDVYTMIEGATDESLGQLRGDLDELLGEDKKKEAEKEKYEEDVNPFSALFGFLRREDKKEEKKDLSRGVPGDGDYEKVIRSQVLLKSRADCRKLFDTYKKVHGMPAFPPTMK